MSHQFTKTDEDRDGQLLFLDGKPDRDRKPRKLLLVGTGVRPGFEHKEEQDIFAGANNYDSVEHWLPGFWKKQISGTNSIGARDMKDLRGARLYNIFQGKETLETAMRTTFDRNDVPPVRRRAPNGTSSRSRTSKKRPLSSHDLSSDEDEELTEAFIGGRVKQRQDKRRLAADIALQNNLNPQRHLILDQTIAERFRISESSPESTIASEPREEQEQHHPQLIDARYTPDGAGRMRYSPLARTQTQLSSEGSTAVNNLVNASAAPDAAARSARLASHAMFDASAPVMARPALANATRPLIPITPSEPTTSMPHEPSLPSLAAQNIPSSTSAPVTNSLPTIASATITQPSMSITTAWTIWLNSTPHSHTAKELQSAVAALTNHTPPLPLLLRATWACANGQVQRWSEHAAYRNWLADNGIELRADLEELMAAEQEGV